MLDADLVDLYGVSTKAFNQAARRNRDRFPDDFVFRVTEDEFEGLRSQIVTSKRGRGGRRYLPNVFTRPQQPARGPSQYRHHACVCPDAADAHIA